MTKKDYLLEQTINNMEHTAAGVRLIYNEIKKLNEKTDEKFRQTEQKFNEIGEMQAHLEKEITLNRGEVGRLKSLVMRKSEELVANFFKNGVSEELYNSKRGHTISYIWIVLKDFYNVATYPEISHVEFENAMNFVAGLEIEDFPEAYYRLPPKMREIAVKNKDRVRHIHFGENSNQNHLF